MELHFKAGFWGVRHLIPAYSLFLMCVALPILLLCWKHPCSSSGIPKNPTQAGQTDRQAATAPGQSQGCSAGHSLLLQHHVPLGNLWNSTDWVCPCVIPCKPWEFRFTTPQHHPRSMGCPPHVPALLVALVKSHLHLLNRGSLLDVDELTAVLIRLAKSFRIKVLRKYRMIKIQLWKMQHASCFLFCLAKQRH